MEKDIVDGQIGEIGSYDVEFKEGKLLAKIGLEKVGLGVNLQVSINSDAVIEAIKKAIPGQIDDAILSLLQTALKS